MSPRDCAANPVDASEHAQHLGAAGDVVQRELPELPVRTVHVDGRWTVSELAADRQDQDA